MRLNDRNIEYFLGQRSNHDPSSLYKPGMSAAQACSFLLTPGRTSLDGTNVGTAALTYTATGRVLKDIEWTANGHTFKVAYQRASDTCSVIYYVDGSGTASTTAIVYYDTDGTTVLTGSTAVYFPTQTTPTFATCPNGVYMALGQSGIFRLEMRTIAASPYVSLVAIRTKLPASSKIVMHKNRLFIFIGDETIGKWTPFGDYERLTPTLAEIEAGTYGIDYRVSLQAEGVRGNVVDCLSFGDAVMCWTQYDCFMIYGNGESGSTAFVKVGDGMGSNGQAKIYENYVAWPSKYKGGTWRGLSFGSVPAKAEDVKVQTEKNIRVATFEIGEPIRDVFQAMPAMSHAVQSVVWDTRADFEAIPSAQRAYLSTTWEPGNLGLQTRDNAMTIAPVTALYPSSAYWSFAGAESYMIDNQPLYPSTTTPTPTLAIWTFSGGGYSELYLSDEVWVHFYDKSGADIITYQSTIFDKSSTWLSYDVNSSEVTLVQFDFVGTYVNGYGARTSATLRIAIPVTGYMSTFRFFLVVNATARTVGIGGIRCEGSAATTATLYTEMPIAGSKAQLSGLTVSANTDFGRFYNSYVGTDYDGTGGILFYIRAGKTVAASLASNTGFTRTSDTRLTDGTKTFVTYGVQIGDYVTIATVKYYITAVAETYVDISGVLPTTAAYGITGGAIASWSDWTAVTGDDLKTGYDLKKLTLKGTATALTADANGNLWVQAKAAFTITNGVSPKLDAMFFTGITGSNLTSISPSGYYSDKFYTCIRSSSSATQPDTECIRYEDGECTVIPGKKATAYSETKDGKSWASTGYCISEQFKGSHNYTGADASTETALLRRWKGEKHTGNLYGGKMAVDIGEYVSDSTLIGASTGALVTPTPALTNMSVDTLTAMDCNASVVGSDGCIYFLSPWVDTTTTGKSAYTNASSVDLVKFDPTTALITRTNVDVTVVSNTEIKAFSLSISPDKNYIHIFWSGLAGNYSQKFNYKKYDVVAGTLGTVVAVATDLSSSDMYYRMSSLTAVNGDIYCAGTINGGSDYVRVYKSINDGTSFTLDKEIAITAGNGDLLQMDINKNNNIVMAYTTTSGAVKTIENTAGIWGTEISVAALTSAASLRMASTNSTDYIFVRVSATCYAYTLISGAWTLNTSFTVATYPIEAIVTKDNTVILLYVVGTTYTSMEFSGTSASTARTMNTSFSVAGVCVAPDTVNNSIYLWVWPNANPSLWKPYKVTLSDVTGTYPLEIKVNTSAGSLLAYSDTTQISEPTILPQSRSMPQTGKTSELEVEISGYGRNTLNSLAYTFSQEN